MTASERRRHIETRLAAASRPLSASALAAELSVSRQIVVGDIALLRASGRKIDATPRGYVAHSEVPAGYTGLVACVHKLDAQLREELYCVVDNGGMLLDVTVENPLYGEISATLHIASRYDANVFLKNAHAQPAGLLSNMTGGVHLHRIACPDAETFARIEQALAAAGILYQK